MDTDVLIAGGGLAGLACAVALRGSGLSVVLVEAGAQLGGRARSWRDELTGDVVDIGPHIITTHHRNYLDLLELCGTRRQVVWQPDPLLTLFDGRRRIDTRLAKLPAPLAIAPALLKARHIPLRARLSNAPPSRDALHLLDEDIERLDACSGEEYLRARGVAPEFTDWFWRTMCMALLNLPLERCSAGSLMRAYAQLIGHSGYCFGFPGVGLGELIDPAARRLIEKAGGRVLPGTALSALRLRDGRCSGGTLSDGTAIAARFVVCALPPAETAALLPEALRETPTWRDIAALEPSRYVSVYLWFDRNLGPDRFWTRVWSPGTYNYDFYDLSNIRPDRAGAGSLIASNIIFSQRLPGMTDAHIIEATLRELAEFCPAARGVQPRHARVHRIPLTVPCPEPGFEALRPMANVDALPGLFLAGDWTRTDVPVSMESAVRSGRLAAEALLWRIGAPRMLALEPSPTTGIAGMIRRARERRLAIGGAQ